MQTKIGVTIIGTGNVGPAIDVRTAKSGGGILVFKQMIKYCNFNNLIYPFPES